MDTQQNDAEALENSLICPICFRFFDTAVIIPTCNHSCKMKTQTGTYYYFANSSFVYYNKIVPNV